MTPEREAKIIFNSFIVIVNERKLAKECSLNMCDKLISVSSQNKKNHYYFVKQFIEGINTNLFYDNRK